MCGIDIEQNHVIAYSDSINWNQVLNKIKPNLNDIYYENSLNNFGINLIELSSALCLR